MSYRTISMMVEDGDLRRRLYACAGQEGVKNPTSFIDANIWELVANSEFDTAYSYAIGNSVDRPGNDEGVISDTVILAHAQPLKPVL